MSVVVVTKQTLKHNGESILPPDTIMRFLCEGLCNEPPFAILVAREPKNLSTVWETIIVEKGTNYQYIPIDNIVRIESVFGESWVHLSNQKTLVSKISISTFAEKLGESYFFSVNSEHLVNLRFMERLTHSSAYITLSNHDSIQISAEAERQLKNILSSNKII